MKKEQAEMEERDNLPFRLNCEGYFINKSGKILAKDSGKGFIFFPGGGVDKSENIEKAIIRETKEETGFTPKNIKSLGILKFIWGPNWAQTDKQKERYKHFQGEEMHFFRGVVDENSKNTTEEDAWDGEKFMEIQEIIDTIEKSRPFDENIKEYRETQLRHLKAIQKELTAK